MEDVVREKRGTNLRVAQIGGGQQAIAKSDVAVSSGTGTVDADIGVDIASFHNDVVERALRIRGSCKMTLEVQEGAFDSVHTAAVAADGAVQPLKNNLRDECPHRALRSYPVETFAKENNLFGNVDGLVVVDAACNKQSVAGIGSRYSGLNRGVLGGAIGVITHGAHGGLDEERAKSEQRSSKVFHGASDFGVESGWQRYRDAKCIWIHLNIKQGCVNYS